MAEDFGARPASPQVACLQGLRSADVVVLILRERYGAVPPRSKVSPTHEEYLEARDGKPILRFVQEGVAEEQLGDAIALALNVGDVLGIAHEHERAALHEVVDTLEGNLADLGVTSYPT